MGGRLRALAWVCVLIFGTAMAMTVTRSAILGTACGLLVLIIGLRSRLLMAAALLLALAGAAFFIFLGDHPSAARFAPGEILGGRNTVARIDAWKTGLEVLREEPLTGRGDGDMKALLMERRRVDVEYDFGHVHNNMIQIAANWDCRGWPCASGSSRRCSWRWVVAGGGPAAMRAGPRGSVGPGDDRRLGRVPRRRSVRSGTSGTPR